MLEESNTPNLAETPEPTPPEEKNNKTFLVIAGIMAGLVVLTLIGLAVYLLVLAPRLNAQRASSQATIEAGNAQMAQQMTMTAQAALWTPTSPATAIPTNTPKPLPTNTPVIALNSPAAPTSTVDTLLIAQQTQQALNATATAAAISAAGSAGMPDTGFFDQIGLPTMILLAFALVVIIFLARRIRRSAAK